MFRFGKPMRIAMAMCQVLCILVSAECAAFRSRMLSVVAVPLVRDPCNENAFVFVGSEPGPQEQQERNNQEGAQQQHLVRNNENPELLTPVRVAGHEVDSATRYVRAAAVGDQVCPIVKRKAVEGCRRRTRRGQSPPRDSIEAANDFDEAHEASRRANDDETHVATRRARQACPIAIRKAVEGCRRRTRRGQSSLCDSIAAANNFDEARDAPRRTNDDEAHEATRRVHEGAAVAMNGRVATHGDDPSSAPPPACNAAENLRSVRVSVPDTTPPNLESRDVTHPLDELHDAARRLNESRDVTHPFDEPHDATRRRCESRDATHPPIDDDAGHDADVRVLCMRSRAHGCNATIV